MDEDVYRQLNERLNLLRSEFSQAINHLQMQIKELREQQSRRLHPGRNRYMDDYDD